ncbi:MAG: cyclase family protein [Chloroflexi bacterium]|nr:cyclase family protein [Chloroflexota bacterium]
MCFEHVAKVVSARYQKEGPPSVSRRNFLKTGAALAAASATGVQLTRPRIARAQEMMGEVVDLSHVFLTASPTYLPDATPARETVVTVENDGFYIQSWNFGEHTGTHVDAPGHFIAGADTIDVYPASMLVSPAAVIDISTRAAEEADAAVTVDDIMAWEAENGELPVGALVCMYSGWDQRWPDIEAFRNADADGVMHFPGFSGEAAEFLVTEREIHGIAVDTLSLDIGSSTTFDTHVTILGAGKYGVEGVANLQAIMGMSAQVIVGVPRWEGGSGGPCRLLALI